MGEMTNYICILLVLAGLICNYFGIRSRIKQGIDYRHTMSAMLIRLVAVVSMLNIIMGFSSDTGQRSGSLSRSILSWILNIIRGRKDITQEVILGSENLLLYEKVLRKMAHMFEYGMLALLIWGFIFCIAGLTRKLAYNSAIISVALVGIADEINQTGIAERTGTYKDVLFDLAGAVVALLILGFLLRKAEVKQNRHKADTKV